MIKSRITELRVGCLTTCFKLHWVFITLELKPLFIALKTPAAMIAVPGLSDLRTSQQ